MKTLDRAHVAQIVEVPIGYWSVCCSCGWHSRSHGCKTEAAEAHHKHATGKSWWQ